MRALTLLAVWLVASACDPAGGAYFGVALPQRPQGDSSTAEAFALVERIVERHGLTPWPMTDRAKNWRTCLGLQTLHICGKTIDGEAQFRMIDRGYWKPNSESLRRELLDSLRARFGTAAVRECRRWQAGSDASRDGCPPLRTTDGK